MYESQIIIAHPVQVSTNVFVHFASFGISFDMESKLFKDVRMW